MSLVMVEVDCDLSEERCSQLKRLLPLPVQERADRYLVPAPRYSLVASQIALRESLSALDIDPKNLRVCPKGRPYVEGHPVEFNLSHSGDRAVILFGRSPLLRNALGVDIEKIDRGVEREALANRFFTSQESRFVGSDASNFFRIWTRKEAVLKTNGIGLRMPLNSFEVLSDEVEEEVTGTALSMGTKARGPKVLVSWAVARSLAEAPIRWVSAHTEGWLQELREGIAE